MRKAFLFISFLFIVSLALIPARISSRKGAMPPLADSAADHHDLHVRASARAVKSYGQLPLSFEVNQGQTDSRVKFLSRGRGYSLFLTSDEAVLSLRSQESGVRSRDRDSSYETRNAAPYSNPLASLVDAELLPRNPFANDNLQSPMINSPAPSPERAESDVLRMKLLGANERAKVTGLDELPGKSNYFIGNDPKKWRTNVATYAKVRYQGVYPGVDLVYYGHEGQMEYDFVVAPGADPSAIQLAIENSQSKFNNPNSKIDANGDLVIVASGGEVRFHKPVVYQEDSKFGSQDSGAPLDSRHPSLPTRHFLDGRYVLRADNRVGFEVSAYDHARPLVIDPVLVYSTYLGGTGDDEALAVAVDSAGNAYVVGFTDLGFMDYSSNFPTANALQASNAGGYDMFVAKLNAAGSALLYSTYLGGSADEGSIGSNGVFASWAGIAVDSAGNAYIISYTASNDFPVVNAFQATSGGGADAFVTKLNPTGSALVYSTYLGGSSTDYGTSIAVDSAGDAYVTGQTASTDFPTLNALYPTYAGGTSDAFVTKFDATGSALVYSTFLGGIDSDRSAGMALDSAGNGYVAVSTHSTNFPTMGAFQATNAGNGDCAITKLNASGSALIYSTFLGGSGEELCGPVAVDSQGNAYVAGGTYSVDFPTANAFSTNMNYNGSDTFVTKLSASGSGLVYSTYIDFGTASEDYANDLAVDASGAVYLTGRTVWGPFVAKLSADGSTLEFSSGLGGQGRFDAGFGVAVDSAGGMYVVGRTYARDFPTENPIQTIHGGGIYDAFVLKFQFSPVSLTPLALNLDAQVLGGTSPVQAVTLTNNVTTNVTISRIEITGANAGDFAQTNNCPASLAAGASCTIDVTFTPTELGSRTAILSVADNAQGSPQTAYLTGAGAPPVAITVQASMPDLAFTIDGSSYAGTQTFTLASGSTHIVSFSSPQAGSAGTQYVFSAWEDGPTSNPRFITVPSESATYTANFLTQYQLTTAVSPANAGYVDMPVSETYVSAGSTTSLTAGTRIESGYVFDNWSVNPPENGTLTNPTSANGATVILTGPATVTANFGQKLPPTADLVSPTPASGVSQTFSMTFSTHNGRDYTDLRDIWVLFSPGQSRVQHCYVEFYQAQNELDLFDDTGFGLAGSLTPGSSATISNSQCTINGAGTSVVGSGPTLILNLSVTASPGFLGTKKIYMTTTDVRGLSSGWQILGTWTPNADKPPTADAVTPTPATGTSQTFSLAYSTQNGKDYTDLIDLQVLFSPYMSDVRQCRVEYTPKTNQLFLITDAGARARLPGSLTPGLDGTLSNSQCTIDGLGTSVSGSGPTLILNLSVTASPTFLATKNIYMVAEDSATQTSGWQIRGAWTPTADTPPTADAVLPTPVSGPDQTFTFAYSTQNGKDYTDLIDVQVLFSPYMTDVQQCRVEYTPRTNQLFLISDAGARTWLPGSLTPGSPGTLSNSQCTINGLGTSVSGSGPTLVLTLSVSASPTFVGNKRIYMVAEDSETSTSGWQIRGAWTPN